MIALCRIVDCQEVFRSMMSSVRTRALSRSKALFMARTRTQHASLSISITSGGIKDDAITGTGKQIPYSLFRAVEMPTAPSQNAAASSLPSQSISHKIPHNRAHKVCTAADAVSLINRGDTVCVSGFVGQGSPDLILKALSERYELEYNEDIDEAKALGELTILFGGGPGDWNEKGLNYLARIPTKSTETKKTGGKSGEQLQSVGESSDSQEGSSKVGDPPKPMVKRAIGAHYGQVPMLGDLAVKNQIEAWTLPMGSISRMIRAQATHSPGHLTTIGLGTYVDPTPGIGNGGAANQLALDSPLHDELVSKVSIGYGKDGDKMRSEYLLYKSLPINVAIIRATTADSSGNLSFEHESLLSDQRIVAMAARNSGGVVLAQVKRLCLEGSLPSRDVRVPGALVDAVIVVPESDRDEFHPMSYTKRNDPVLCGEIKSPVEDLPKMPLNERKIIARRASFALKPGKVVNLGIGLPEGLANVAAEEGNLPYITLTTEPGVFGGIPASGHDFGPAFNADAIVEMNNQFDFYGGGGLDACFLGAAQISANGDVNVSRMSKDRLTGPGGFIDISQSTRNICFMASFTAKGLDISFDGENGSISIVEDGKIKKFVNKVYERTFSGDEAVRRGQRVYYVTERAVFRRSAAHDVLELVEIAPGIDLEKDVLNQMEFEPVIGPSVQLMDERIFKHEKMNLELFGSLRDRIKYHSDDHLVYINLFGISLASEEEVKWFGKSLSSLLDPITKSKGPIDAIVTYDGFDLRTGLEGIYAEVIADIEAKYYRAVRRFSGKAFRASKLRKKGKLENWDSKTAFQLMDEDHNGILSREEFRRGMRKMFGLKLTPAELEAVCPEGHITRSQFDDKVNECLKSCG